MITIHKIMITIIESCVWTMITIHKIMMRMKSCVWTVIKIHKTMTHFGIENTEVFLDALIKFIYPN